MRKIIYLLLILWPGINQAQSLKQIDKLLQGKELEYGELPFPAVFQKVQIYNNELHCTVLDLNTDLQMYVVYSRQPEGWYPSYLGPAGTFYAGNGITGSIIPGGKAIIKGIKNPGNQRDVIKLPDEQIWFTSDINGYFQIYRNQSPKPQKIEINELSNQHIFNLWADSFHIYFDVINDITPESSAYLYYNNELKKLSFTGKSISFTDNLLVYIYNDQLKIFYLEEANQLVKFVFFFLNNDYEQAISLTQSEAEYLKIDSNSVFDGVIKANALEDIKQNLIADENFFSTLRREQLLNLIEPESQSEIISFVFFFLDDNYEQALSLTKAEAEHLELDSNAIIDGVIKQSALQKIQQSITADHTFFESDRKNELLNKISPGSNSTLISFVFFFLDEEYESAVSLTPTEAKFLGLNENSLSDGIVKQEYRDKAISILETDNEHFNQNRKETLSNIFKYPKNEELVAFYGFFADTSNWISDVMAVEEVDSMGIISTPELKEYIKKVENNEKKENLTQILIQRAWDEDIPLSITDTVTVQLGAYLNYYSDFALYLFNKAKINDQDYQYLKSLDIFVVNTKGLFLYRSKVPANELLKIKNTVYFDKPFIVHYVKNNK